MTVFSFISASGGCGRTALACGAAAALARKENNENKENSGNVLVIDMCAGNRMADMYLGLDSRIVYDLSDALDGEHDRAITMHGGMDRLSFIAAPLGNMSIGADTFAAMLAKIRDKFEWIILDCPTGFSENTRTALLACDKSFIIVTPENAAVRAAERVVSEIRSAGLCRPDVIVNRVIPEYIAQGTQLSPDAVAQSLDLRVIAAIRENDGIYRACLGGTIAALNERSMEYAAMLALAERLRTGEAPKGYMIKKRFISSQVYISEVPA